jgi:hypothetical protein
MPTKEKENLRFLQLSIKLPDEIGIGSICRLDLTVHKFRISKFTHIHSSTLLSNDYLGQFTIASTPSWERDFP